MAGICTDPDAYYRVYKALHLVTHEALPCIDNALKVWHTNKQQTLPPCIGQCPDGKKPKLSTSCQRCVNWGNAIEATVYQPTGHPVQPQVTWQNVIVSNLGKSHVEVAKAFVLRLPKTKGSSAITSLSAFDSASVLMLMAKFGVFHGCDQDSYDKIKKVADIRNELSHLGLQKNMSIDDQKVKQYFRDLESFVACVEQLHPQIFTSAQYIRTNLSTIQLECITGKMKEEICIELQEMHIELQEVTTNLQKSVDKLYLQENVPSPDLTWCQNQLKADYKSNKGGIGFLPEMPKEFPLQEFFVDLSLVQEEKRPTSVKLKELVKYTDLLTLESERGYHLKHVLVRGEAGTGKSTMLSKLSYQWAICQQEKTTSKNGSPLSRFELIFALDIRQFKPNMDLVDCIHDQLQCDMSKSAIKSMLVSNAGKCLFLFDGYDELKSHLHSVLSSKLLLQSHVIVTTRPDKVDEFCHQHNGYVHVQLTGFSEESRKVFVSKYFDEDEGIASDLLRRIQTSYLYPLSFYPLLLAMLCTVFHYTGNLSERVTNLYEEAVEVFALQFFMKSSPQNVVTNPVSTKTQFWTNSILNSLGSTALKGLLEDDNKLIFTKDEFETKDGTDITEEAVKLGLLTRVTCSTFRKSKQGVQEFSFLHKTYQDFFAGRFWSSLAVSASEKFMYYLKFLTNTNIHTIKHLLIFCCGSSKEATEILLKYLVTELKIDWTWPVTLLYESESNNEISPNLHALVGQMNKLELGAYMHSGGRSSELWTILHHYLHMKKNHPERFIWLNNIDYLDIVTPILTDGFYTFAPVPAEARLGLPIEVVLTRFQNFLMEATKSSSFSLATFSFHGIECDTLSTTLFEFLKQQPHITQFALCARMVFPPFVKDIETYLRESQTWGAKLFQDLLTVPVKAQPLFDTLLPNLVCLGIDYMNLQIHQWKTLLDTIIKVGKRVNQLPMRSLTLTEDILFSFGLQQGNPILLMKLAEALLYLSKLEYLRIGSRTCVTKIPLIFLGPVLERMHDQKELNIGNNVEILKYPFEAGNVRFFSPSTASDANMREAFELYDICRASLERDPNLPVTI